MEDLSNRVNVRLARNNKKLNWTSKPIYVAQEIFDNLVVICKIKSTLTLPKPAHVGINIQ